jgi:hypothetical protein
MSISIGIAVHPQASLPAGSRVHIRTPMGDQTVSIPSPGMFFDSQLVGPLPPLFRLELDFEIGTPPINMRVDQAPNDLHLALMVLPGRPPSNKSELTGSILHARRTPTTQGCTVTCLNDDAKSSGDGNCCVDCENNDAIVKICC